MTSSKSLSETNYCAKAWHEGGGGARLGENRFGSEFKKFDKNRYQRARIVGMLGTDRGGRTDTTLDMTQYL